MDKVAGVILAGGEGSRFGGVIKPLLRVGGEPILITLIARMRPRVFPLYISIGKIDAKRFADFDADALVKDQEDVSGGPLAGIFASVSMLRAAGQKPDWLLSVAGDCPDLPENLAERLKKAMTETTDVVFAAYAGQSYPPNALWRFSALSAHFDALDGNPRGMGPRHMVAPERRRDATFPERFGQNPFAGLNSPADLVRSARNRRESK